MAMLSSAKEICVCANNARTFVSRPHPDLDKIFVETDQHSSNIPDLDDNMNSNQKLLETILHVQDRVTSLERKVTTLEEENLKLKQHIIQLDNGGVNNPTSTKRNSTKRK